MNDFCRDASEAANVILYERAANYGRPLFAIMARQGILRAKMSTLICRMLLLPEGGDWEQDQNAVLNILGTRIQWGKISVETATALVANGYANVSECSRDSRTIQLSFLPDG